MTTKPTDYKAEAKAWCVASWQTDSTASGEIESLATLLERLCGEAHQEGINHGIVLCSSGRDEDMAEARQEGRREQREKALHERSPEEKAELLPRLEILSERLCQTQAYVLDALERAGLTVVPIREAKP